MISKRLKSAPGTFAQEGDTRVQDLRLRLEQFYAKENYPAFHEGNNHVIFWKPLKDTVERHLSSRSGATGKLKVLELGAGRTTFADLLGPARREVDFHVQDITDRNLDYLKSQADEVHIQPLTSLKGSYDLIFSTFVWEHLTNPRECLDHLLTLLTPGGSLMFIAPRYDFPFYVSPSCKHLSKLQRFSVSFWIMWKRLQTIITRKPLFLIHTDPAILHTPWFRDADAIHWVSAWDLKFYLGANYNLRRIRFPMEGYYGQIWEKFCLLFVEIQSKRNGAT
jgi:2-polyprenyl-3-methyl-5-hydroxy-6-metoxy-1,4-benzoquinol methylase